MGNNFSFRKVSKSETVYREDSGDNGDNIMVHERNGKIFLRENNTLGYKQWYEHPTSHYPYRHGDKPCYISIDGDMEWRNEKGILSRINGPARITECKIKKKHLWSEERSTLETFREFYNCKERWWYNGNPVSKEWIEENKHIIP